MPAAPQPGSGKEPASKRPGRKATRERSAGVIVYRDVRDPAGRPRRLFLLLDYGRHWDYPKGHLEKGEDDLSAARRELREETGIDAARFSEGFSHQIDYFFHSRRKGPVRKEVIFFAARTEQEAVRLSEEHVGYAWLDRDAALERLTFENARKVLSAAADFLDEREPVK